MEINYEPSGPVVEAFLNSPAFFRGIMGPFGSGKSSGCVIEILRRSAEQAPSLIDGKRKTRWAIIRNSYPELKTTTMKTWFQWCPKEFGKANYDSPIVHHIRTDDMDMEVLFIALDKEDDVRKLLSLELTGAWLNEAREIPKAIVDAVTARVGRYPAKIEGGPTWFGLMGDTNPPDDQSWWYNLCEEETPPNWEFFKQPGGQAPGAENTTNLPPNYYQNMRGGKDADWIKVYIDGEYGFVTEGKPVYPNYRDSLHAATEPIEPVAGLPLLLGVDFGLTPAAVIGQKLPDGRWLILDELCAEDCGVTRFATLLNGHLAQFYPRFNSTIGWGDPAGTQRAQTDERTAFEIMELNSNVKWTPAPTNEFSMRREVVLNALNRLVDGYPGLLVSPKAKMIRKGFSGGYHFKLIKSGNGTQVHSEPNKNSYSHCFKGDVLVSTPAGDRHISELSAGDLVNTPLGARRITAAMSRETDSFARVFLSDGTFLECTPEHPLYAGEGFIRADALQYSDLVYKDPAWDDHKSTRSLFSMGLAITESLTAIIRRIAARVGSIFIAPFGNFIVAASHKGSRFITETEIRAITRSITWKSSALPFMHPCTARSAARLTLPVSDNKYYWPNNMPLDGIAQKREDSGTASTPKVWRANLPWSSITAFFAGSLTPANSEHGRRVFAECPVRVAPENVPGLMILPAAAPAAKPLSSATNTLRSVTVLRVALERQPVARVYDLTVDDAHCFYANGILVSNCHDALQYLLLGGGEFSVVMKTAERRNANRPEVMCTGMDYDVFAHGNQ